MPTFSAPLDCTPWVTGGLWPAELLPGSAETATLAEYLKVDLQRIATSANEDLRAIGRAGMAYPVRRDAEARVIDEARSLAVRRVESTMRQLRQMRQHSPPAARFGANRLDLEKTQVIPAIRDAPPRAVDLDKTQVIPAVRDEPPADPILPVTEPTPPPAEPTPPSADSTPPAAEPTPVPADVAEPRPAANDEQRLQRLLAFVARQEPRLSWAVGELPDGTTMLVTDLAHGWIPSGIELPDGVHLLAPQRRSGRVSELLGNPARAATYNPGDPANWPTDGPATATSVQARELPQVDDLDWELRVATHWRDGLPRLVNAVTKAIAAGGEIAEQEVDLLRVHLDTARYQVLAEYPDVDAAQLQNCLLLAATTARAMGDRTSANYHFAWFQSLESRAQTAPSP